jgi:hypothetical protein
MTPCRTDGGWVSWGSSGGITTVEHIAKPLTTTPIPGILRRRVTVWEPTSFATYGGDLG